MKTSISIILLFVLLFAPGISKKKYPQEDRQAWFGVQVEYNISRTLNLGISEELRYYKDRTTLAQSLTDIGASCKFDDWFKAGLYFRYRNMLDEQEERIESYANFTFKFAFEGFDINNRIRLHVKFRENRESINYFRNKLTLGYNATDWLEPYISAEIFYRFMYDEGDRLAQGRYYIGTKIKITGNHEFDLFLMREQEYNTDKAIHSNILGIEYSLSL